MGGSGRKGSLRVSSDAPRPDFILLVILFFLSVATPSPAITIGFDPPFSSSLLGESLSVEVVVSDLGGEVVSAYDLEINYDPFLLTAIGVSFGDLLNGGDPFFSFQDSDVSAPGRVDLAESSLLSDLDLSAIQPPRLVLATLLFNPLLPGTSSLSFTFDPLNDVKGSNNRILPLDVGTGHVTVMVPVPEPAAGLLLSGGLWVLALSRKLFRKKRLIS